MKTPILGIIVLTILGTLVFQEAYGITIDNFDEEDVQIPLGPALEFVQVDQTGLTGVIGDSRTIGVTHSSGTGSLFTIHTTPTLGQLSFSADSGVQASAVVIYNADNTGLNLDLSNEDGIRLTINDLTTPVNLEITLNDNSFITSTGFTQSIFPTAGPFTVEALFSDFNIPFDFSDVGSIEFRLIISNANGGIIIESIETFNLNNDLVGGELIPIETTSLILAGTQSFSWMIPVLLSVLGIGLFVVSRKV